MPSPTRRGVVHPSAAATPESFFRLLAPGADADPATSPGAVERSATPRSHAGDSSGARCVSAEWERQLEVLGQKEMELQQTQVKLVREHAVSIVKDVGALRHELAAVKARQASLEKSLLSRGQEAASESCFPSASLVERLVALESRDKAGSARDFEDQAIRDAHLKHLTTMEAKLDEAHAHLTTGIETLQAERLDRASWAKRLAQLEVAVIGVAGGHDTGAAWRSQLQAEAGAGAACQDVRRDAPSGIDHPAPGRTPLLERIEGLEKVIGDTVAGHTATGVSVCQASIQERLHCQERLLLKTSEVQSRELRALREMCNRHDIELQSLRDSAGAEQDDRGPFALRVALLEQSLADIVAERAQEFRMAQAQASDPPPPHELVSASVVRANLLERMAQLERLLSEALEQINMELRDAQEGRTEQLRHIVDKALEQRVGELRNLRQAQAEDAVSEHSSHGAQSALLERVKSFERRFTDAYSKDFAGLKEAQSHHARALEMAATTLEERIDGIEEASREQEGVLVSHGQMLQEAQEKQAAAAERLAYIERLLGDSAAIHRKALKSLESTGAQLHALHTSLPERLSTLERKLAESSERHAKQLKGFSEAQRKHADSLKGASRSNSVFEGRLANLEKDVEDMANRMQQELSALSDRQSVDVAAPRPPLDEHMVFEQRLAALEDFLGESAEKHARVIEALRESQVRIGAEQSRLGKDLDDLRTMGAELSALQASHAHFTAEVRSQLDHNARSSERLDVLERRLRSCFSG